jgi:hypothetical protein
MPEPTPDRYSVEWRRRTAFAEVADALGIPTDQVMAAMPAQGGQPWTVLYTPERSDSPDAEVFAAHLDRDAGGVLVAYKRARAGTVADFLPYHGDPSA